MKETMLTNIHQEKDVLSKILIEFEEKNRDLIFAISQEKIKNILILATGSSMNSALSIKYFLEKSLDTVVHIEEPFNYYNYEKVDGNIDLIVGISQSGKSASTIKAMEYVQKNTNSKTVVLTSNPTSPITQYTDYVLDLNMGIENVGFVTKGFSATLLNMILFSLYIGKEKGNISLDEFNKKLSTLNKMIELVPTVISKTEKYFERNQKYFKDCERFICIGYGACIGISKEFETKFTETVRYPSQGFELEAYMHGPYLEANKKHCLFYLDCEGFLSERLNSLKNYMQDYVGFSSIIGFGKDKEKDLNFDIEKVDEDLLILLMVIPIQLLSYRIAYLKGVNLEIRIFDDFDNVLKSKI
ncbi:SIS domain-containing protein [uncultured Fusobacterium sp.]|uniref:SIS domain-containing protein n=1 Tax=uncultured Fusobacterium sp. TaxID=159267 RepID=UPI0025E526BE|nr:SIS domain-containing protein [uncultured Fusobacterium sp.]